MVHPGDSLITGQNQSPHIHSLKTRFEKNFVCRWTVESELKSVKSNNNLISRKYFEDNQEAVIVIRVGSGNLISENVMVQNRDFSIMISRENNRVIENSFSRDGYLAYLHAEID